MQDFLLRYRWWCWSAYALAWTTALLVPVPSGDWPPGPLDLDLRFGFAKLVHLSAYAVFAALTGWLRAPPRYRFVLMFVLMGHATLTEMLQYLLEFIGRYGSLSDVALDHVGIAIRGVGGEVVDRSRRVGWHALRYSEGRGSLARYPRPSEYLRACHAFSRSCLSMFNGCACRSSAYFFVSSNNFATAVSSSTPRIFLWRITPCIKT